MAPRVLCCDACDIKVKGRFRASEFEALSPELLHFLRIFVHCEGRIKDMERSLGISYPTVKTMIANLKKALNMPEDSCEGTADPIHESQVDAPSPEAAKPADSRALPDSLGILAMMESGQLTYQEGLRLLKATSKQARK